MRSIMSVYHIRGTMCILVGLRDSHNTACQGQMGSGTVFKRYSKLMVLLLVGTNFSEF